METPVLTGGFNDVDYEHVLAAEILADSGTFTENARVREELRTLWGNPTDIRTTEQTGVCWGAFALKYTGGRIAVFMHGVWGPQSSIRLCNGYYVSRDQAISDYGGFNRSVWQTATDIYENLIAPLYSPGSYFSLYGHSAGGGCAEALGRILGYNFGYPVKDLVTFGAPKVALSGFIPHDLGINRARYMAFGDPVPAIPGGLASNGVHSWLAGGGPNSIVYEMSHGSGGMFLQGRFLVTRHEAVLDGDPAGKINRWVARLNPEVRYHGTDNYARQMANLERPREIITTNEELGRFAEGQLQVQRRGAAAIAPDVPQFVLPIDLSIQENMVLPMFLNVVGGDVVLPNGSRVPATSRRNATMPQAKVGVELKWTFQRVGTGVARYYVYFMGRLVARATSRSAAKTLCRRGNLLCRQMGSNLYWDTSELVQSWQDFATAATSGNGFTPALRQIG